MAKSQITDVNKPNYCASACGSMLPAIRKSCKAEKTELRAARLQEFESTTEGNRNALLHDQNALAEATIRDAEARMSERLQDIMSSMRGSYSLSNHR
ncbi:hypothetical protein JX266_002908 [Neoarthrinium moseri]|nr:hypothetical protein JX266_002908 [Neoarthrinium moseri]